MRRQSPARIVRKAGFAGESGAFRCGKLVVKFESASPQMKGVIDDLSGGANPFPGKVQLPHDEQLEKERTKRSQRPAPRIPFGKRRAFERALVALATRRPHGLPDLMDRKSPE